MEIIRQLLVAAAWPADTAYRKRTATCVVKSVARDKLGLRRGQVSASFVGHPHRKSSPGRIPPHDVARREWLGHQSIYPQACRQTTEQRHRSGDRRIGYARFGRAVPGVDTMHVQR